MHLATEQSVKAFLQERYINNDTARNSPDLNPIKNSWWKSKSLVNEKAPSCKADMLTAIQESWFSLMENIVFPY